MQTEEAAEAMKLERRPPRNAAGSQRGMNKPSLAWYRRLEHSLKKLLDGAQAGRSVEWHWKPGTFRGASAGQQGDEDLGVGGTPAGDRVPAGSGLVAGDRDRRRGGAEDHRVVAGGDVVERLVVQRAAGDPVDGGVDEAERVAGLLVGQGDQAGPERRAGAGAAGPDEPVARRPAR